MRDAEVREFRSQMKLLQRRLSREVLQPGSSAGALSRSALHVLGVIARRGGISPREVGDELQMTSSNVAAALRELTAAALVHRRSDPDDGRRVRLTASPAGEALVARFRSEQESWLGRAIRARLDAEEQVLLQRAGALLVRLAEFEPAGREI